MGASSSAWMISRMEVSRPPGVSISTTRAPAWRGRCVLHGVDQEAGQRRVDDAVRLRDPDVAGSRLGSRHGRRCRREQQDRCRRKDQGDDGQSECSGRPGAPRAGPRAGGVATAAPGSSPPPLQVAAPLSRRPARGPGSRAGGRVVLVEQAPDRHLKGRQHDRSARRSARISKTSPQSCSSSKPLALQKGSEKNSQCSSWGVPPSRKAKAYTSRRRCCLSCFSAAWSSRRAACLSAGPSCTKTEEHDRFGEANWSKAGSRAGASRPPVRRVAGLYSSSAWRHSPGGEPDEPGVCPSTFEGSRPTLANCGRGLGDTRAIPAVCHQAQARQGPGSRSCPETHKGRYSGTLSPPAAR